MSTPLLDKNLLVQTKSLEFPMTHYFKRMDAEIALNKQKFEANHPFLLV